MAKTKYREEWVMSEDCRRSTEVKETFLQWMKDNYAGKKNPPAPAEIVGEAMRKSSVLHGLFDWDVQRVARRAWLDEASYLLRHLYIQRVEVRTGEVIAGPIRAFPAVATQQYGVRNPEDYVNAKRVARDPTLKATVIERAGHDFQMWADRYRRYAEFLNVYAPVLEAFDKIKKDHKHAG